MSDRKDVHGLEGFRFAVGLSSVIELEVEPGQIVTAFKYFNGGTLELVSGQTAAPWGLGYVFGVGEAIEIDSSTNTYFAATGSTVTVMALRGRSAGFENV